MVASDCSRHADGNSTETLFTYPELSSSLTTPVIDTAFLPHSAFKLLTLGVIVIIDVLVSVSSIAALRHHDQKTSWGGKGLFGLHLHISVHH